MTLEQFEAQASEKRLLAKVLIGLIVFFVIVGALFGEKKPTSTTTAVPHTNTTQPAPRTERSAPSDPDFVRRLKKWNGVLEEAKNSSLWRPVFKCDYTTRTCLRGYNSPSSGSIFVELDVLQILAEDRKTVLEHVYCKTTAGFRGNLYTDCHRVELGRRTMNNTDMGPW